MNRARTLLAFAAVAATTAVAGCGSDSAQSTSTAPAAATSAPATTAPAPATAAKPAGLPAGFKAKAARRGATRQVFNAAGQPAMTSAHKPVLVSADGKLITPDGKPAIIDPAAAPKPPASKPTPAPKGADKAPALTPSSPAAVAKNDMPLIWLGATFAGVKATVSTFDQGGGGYLVTYTPAKANAKPAATVVVAKLPAGAKAAPLGAKSVTTPVGDGQIVHEKGRPDAVSVIVGAGNERYSVVATVGDGPTASQVAHALTKR
jgi:hypothetical protein